MVLAACAMTGAVVSCASSRASVIDLTRAIDLENARQLKIETEIALCMKSRGFEYAPVDRSTTNRKLLTYNAQRFSRSVMLEWGYGVATALGPDRGRFPGLIDLGPEVGSPVPGAHGDDASARAYTVALEGQGPGEPIASDSKGCQSMASAKYATEANTADLSGDFTDVSRTDAASAQRRDAWRACMQRSGYTYEGRQAIVDHLKARLGSVVLGPDGYPAAGDTVLGGIIREEFAIAGADVACV